MNLHLGSHDVEVVVGEKPNTNHRRKVCNRQIIES
jgi:hypothetical protein